MLLFIILASISSTVFFFSFCLGWFTYMHWWVHFLLSDIVIYKHWFCKMWFLISLTHAVLIRNDREINVCRLIGNLWSSSTFIAFVCHLTRGYLAQLECVLWCIMLKFDLFYFSLSIWFDICRLFLALFVVFIAGLLLFWLLYESYNILYKSFPMQL